MTNRLLALAALLLVICGGMTTGCTTAQRLPEQTPKAVFIIVDGIPADVVERVATPELDALSAQGGYARAYVGGAVGTVSESPTVSATGYNSLLTGTWANKHGVRDNAIENPDYRYWDIFRIAKAHDPALRTAIFSTWLDNRTKLVGDGLAAAGGRKIDYHFDGLEHDTERFPHDDESDYIRRIDAAVAGEAARYIRAIGPDLSWVYLQYTDDIGHEFGDGPEMTAAVRQMDEHVGKIRAAIGAREQRFDEDWLVMVTTDHGRDAATGKDHGGQSARERTTWIVASSPRLNARFGNRPGIVDILPSVAMHLDLEIPVAVRSKLDGRSFIDAR
ncbi:MAG: alkaline phosphatase family protein [Woeseiaceae bacterium]|nr:alkaline phosphatase family protein [Woeseiaceae bacterium]